MTATDRFSRPAHPRLALVVVLGVVFLAIGGLLWTAEVAALAATGLLGFRVGFLGFLLFVFGASGYVAIAAFERQPQR